MKKPQKPIKKYKTIVELYKNLTYNCSDKSKSDYLWICYVCRGYGKIKDRSQYCPIEGLKMADYIQCPVCSGKKGLNREFYQEKFKEYLTKYENELQLYYRNIKFYESIKSKLSKEEWEWLQNAYK